jgi:membrane-bound inhibitor of C-type lysozyme
MVGIMSVKTIKTICGNVKSVTIKYFLRQKESEIQTVSIQQIQPLQSVLVAKGQKTKKIN